MKIGFLQFYPQLFNEIKNLDTICKLMQDCEADLIVLPELATSGYIFTDRNELAHYTAPAYSGRIANFFRQLSQKYKCAIVTGFAENENNHFFNSQMLVLPNGKIHIYRKTHLFYKEKEIFNPGDTGLNVFEYKGVNLGLMICFDWIFPESARTLALKGADIICHSANLVLPFCQKAMVTRSIENRVFIITANRFGSEKNADEKFNFTGMSQITDVTGNVLINAGKDEECVKIVDIEPKRARNKNVTEFNNIFLDRKEEFYKV